MADKRQRRACRPQGRAEGHPFSGKDTPTMSSSYFLEEFVVYPDVSDQIEQESYPTKILDDSCVSEVMSIPSIPLVESVEAFFLGLRDTPFGHLDPNVDVPMIKQEHLVVSSVIPNVDVPMIKQESHALQLAKVEKAEVDEQLPSNNPHPSLVNGQLPAEDVKQPRICLPRN
ncbi:hypothetical protein SOVF_065530 [Spinacia oleracea]|nr:hypothetical protein SOVF_065530 [Spinacia oleracea]